MIIKLREDTPKRVAELMLDELYKFIESGEHYATIVNFKENLDFSLTKRDNICMIEIMGNPMTKK